MPRRSARCSERVRAEMIPDPEAEGAIVRRRLGEAWHRLEAQRRA